MPDFDNPFMPPEEPEHELCHRCWEADCPGTCGYPIKEPEDAGTPSLRNFPYFDVCKVRNMMFAMNIPVFTALESQAGQVEDGYVRFTNTYCCN